MRADVLRFPLALLCVLAGASAFAAGFDCAKARSPVEKQICADAELSRLDELLARFYPAARDKLQENARCLVTDQQQWLRTRNACDGGACLKTAYLARLTELVALQPGMNLPRDLELPPGPQLAWAVAPLPELAGGTPPASRPFRIEGQLGWGCPECGYYLRAGGKSYVMLGDMFLGGATATSLSVILETGKQARFAARGRLLEKEESGIAYFDNRHCVYLYRLN